jgi:hypothetical protein
MLMGEGGGKGNPSLALIKHEVGARVAHSANFVGSFTGLFRAIFIMHR